MGRYRETTQSSSWARSRKTPRQTVGSSSMNVVIADIRGSSRSNLGSLRLLTTCSRAGHCARQEPRNDPARSWNRCWRVCPRTKFDDLSRLGLIGTHERFPKALRYAKLNQLCHDPLPLSVSLRSLCRQDYKNRRGHLTSPATALGLIALSCDHRYRQRNAPLP